MKKTFETFREISNYTIDCLKRKHPSCFNGNVEVVKYRVTIEEIEEPKEVLAERLQKLWDECDHLHHWSSLKYVAKKIGYELKGSPGSKREKS